MTSVLFVDDEPILLRTVRRGVALHRPRWIAHFAGSGAEALAWLAEHPTNIVVTDVSMPDMDGLTLLGHVREQHPHMSRIVLSGNPAGNDERGLVFPHQWISKPCSMPQMCATIDRVDWARRLVDDQAGLVGRVLGGSALPSSPPVFTRLVAALERLAPISEIVAIVSQDPAIAAKLLQFASSAFYGEAGVSTIERAVAVVGTRRLGSIVLTAELFCAGNVRTELLEHSQRVAQIAHDLRGAASDAVVAGLLHHIGAIAVGAVAGVAERDLARLGGLLLGTWGLAFPIASAVAYCDDPEASPDPRDPTLATLALADALARDLPADIVEVRAAAAGLDLAACRSAARQP